MAEMAAGERLRARMDQALAQGLEWSEHELELLDAAARCADRREELEVRWSVAEDDAVRVKLSAEIRLLDKAQNDYLARVNPTGEERPRSLRHQAAARARWDRARDGA